MREKLIEFIRDVDGWDIFTFILSPLVLYFGLVMGNCLRFIIKMELGF